MANTIANFLVGLGLDTSEFDEGSKRIDSGINSIKSSALQLAALGAGAFGAQQLTFGFAQATDNVGKFSRVFSILPEDVTAFGRALEHEGGTLAGFMSQIENLERIRAMTPDQIGGFFAQAGITGIDPNLILDANNVTEAYLRLSDVFANLNQRERIKAAELFGFDEASIRLLSNGRAEVEKLVEREKELRPITEQMTKEAARFNDVTQDLGTNIGAIADTISISLLPALSDVIEDMNSWLEVNKEFINTNLGDALEPIAENMDSIAAAGALLASGGFLKTLAGMARFIPGIGVGLSIAAGAASTLATAGAIGVGAYAVTKETDSPLIDPTNPITSLIASTGFDFVSDYFNSNNDDVINPINYFPTDDNGNFRLPGSPAFQGFQSGNQRPLQVNLVLDGQVIEQKIIDVTESQYENAITDITSSTGG